MRMQRLGNVPHGIRKLQRAGGCAGRVAGAEDSAPPLLPLAPPTQRTSMLQSRDSPSSGLGVSHGRVGPERGALHTVETNRSATARRGAGGLLSHCCCCCAGGELGVQAAVNVLTAVITVRASRDEVTCHGLLPLRARFAVIRTAWLGERRGTNRVLVGYDWVGEGGFEGRGGGGQLRDAGDWHWLAHCAGRSWAGCVPTITALTIP